MEGKRERERERERVCPTERHNGSKIIIDGRKKVKKRSIHYTNDNIEERSVRTQLREGLQHERITY
jgi:hypothetical protein